MKLINIELIQNAGNVKALAKIEAESGSIVTCRIVKQAKARAYLDTPPGFALTHKQKRSLQREAVTLWGDMISGTLAGRLESEKVFKGSRFNRLGVQLKVFCPICDRNTHSEFSETPRGLIRNACYFCGTLRKGKPCIGRDELERIQDYLNARKGTGEEDVPSDS